MKFFQQARSILGMNARNLHFIDRYNTSESKKFADNKLYTKNYLSARGIGAAKVYTVIKNHKELEIIDPKTLPDEFVIKPNKGYGGEGIVVIVSRKGNTFFDVNGNARHWKELYYHMGSILDGRYAISGLFDQVIVEELLLPHAYFELYIERGLPDIRIIVFNYVPIVAMLRIPTTESEGKANLHLGAVGVGIDIVNGKATYAVHHNRFVRTLPNGKKVSDIEIPDWQGILLTAAKCQHASQIKYLAVDIALTKSGIKVLELNARAGLGVQIANQIPLKRRLEKVVDLTVPNPEKGVEISKSLFGVGKVDLAAKQTEMQKKIIGLFETVDILHTPHENILARIDPFGEKILMDNKYQTIDTDERFVEISLKETRIRGPFEFVDLSREGHKIIIGGRLLQDFLIDPQLKQTSSPMQKASVRKSAASEKILANVDRKLTELSSDINILSYLKPVNYIQERTNFFAHRDTNPQFIYKKPQFDYDMVLRELRSLPKSIRHPLSSLFLKKIKELVSTLEVIDSIGTPEFSQHISSLYPAITNALYADAVQYIEKHRVQLDESREMSHKQVIKKLETFLKDHKLAHWKLEVRERQASDIAVDKKGTIFLKQGVAFTENRLRAVILHEICTHIYRLENGKLQQYGIFRIGTAGYLPTEEGLAIYNQQTLHIPLGQKELRAALRVIATYEAGQKTFAELFAYIQETYRVDDDEAWNAAFRAKRGMSDTSLPGACTRDTVYWKGYRDVEKYIAQHGRRGIKELYVGKIGIEDVRYLQHLGEYVVKYLPPEEIEV